MNEQWKVGHRLVSLSQKKISPFRQKTKKKEIPLDIEIIDRSMTFN